MSELAQDQEKEGLGTMPSGASLQTRTMHMVALGTLRDFPHQQLRVPPITMPTPVIIFWRGPRPRMAKRLVSDPSSTGELGLSQAPTPEPEPVPT
jgi:hypothetical protein